MDAIFAAADITALAGNVSTLLIGFVGVYLLFLGYRYLMKGMGFSVSSYLNDSLSRDSNDPNDPENYDWNLSDYKEFYGLSRFDDEGIETREFY